MSGIETQSSTFPSVVPLHSWISLQSTSPTIVESEFTQTNSVHAMIPTMIAGGVSTIVIFLAAIFMIIRVRSRHRRRLNKKPFDFDIDATSWSKGSTTRPSTSSSGSSLSSGSSRKPLPSFNPPGIRHAMPSHPRIPSSPTSPSLLQKQRRHELPRGTGLQTWPDTARQPSARPTYPVSFPTPVTGRTYANIAMPIPALRSVYTTNPSRNINYVTQIPNLTRPSISSTPTFHSFPPSNPPRAYHGLPTIQSSYRSRSHVSPSSSSSSPSLPRSHQHHQLTSLPKLQMQFTMTVVNATEPPPYPGSPPPLAPQVLIQPVIRHHG